MSTDKNRGEWPSRELAKIAGADDWGKVKGGDHQDLSLGFDRSVISGIKYNHI